MSQQVHKHTLTRSSSDRHKRNEELAFNLDETNQENKHSKTKKASKASQEESKKAKTHKTRLLSIRGHCPRCSDSLFCSYKAKRCKICSQTFHRKCFLLHECTPSQHTRHDDVTVKRSDEIKQIEELFMNYCNKDKVFEIKELTSFLEDMNIDPFALEGLIALWILQVEPVSGSLSMKQFVKSMQEHNCRTTEDISAVIKQTQENISHSFDEFKKCYFYAFELCKIDSTQKSIDCTTAIEALQQALSELKEFAFLEAFCEFLRDKQIKTLTFDQWRCFYEFSLRIESDLSNFPTVNSYPLLIDEFVKWLKC